MTENPSGPGALRSCIQNSVALISSGDGMRLSSEFSASVMQGRTKCSRWVGKLVASWLNRLLKFSKNSFLISLESVIQDPSSSQMASVLFLFLLIMVDRWKNLVFLSPSLSQSSLDFWRHRVSLLRCHSSSSDWRDDSKASVLTEGGFSWVSFIF